MENTDEMLQMMKVLTEEIKLIRLGQKEYMKEIIELKKENKDLREKLLELENKITKMEKTTEESCFKAQEKLQQQKRALRKNNIIIKGLEINEQTVVKEAETLIGNLQDNIKIKEIGLINKQKNIVLVKLSTWEDKKKIMTNKNKLSKSGVKNVYIEDDMTKEERSIQYELRKVAKEMKSKKKIVKMGYQKIFINGEKYEWDTTKNELKKVDRQTNN